MREEPLVDEVASRAWNVGEMALNGKCVQKGETGDDGSPSPFDPNISTTQTTPKKNIHKKHPIKFIIPPFQISFHRPFFGSIFFSHTSCKTFGQNDLFYFLLGCTTKKGEEQWGGIPESERMRQSPPKKTIGPTQPPHEDLSLPNF